MTRRMVVPAWVFIIHTTLLFSLFLVAAAPNMPFYTKEELNTSDGSPPNVGSNRVHWDNLSGVPAGFADGMDNDTTYNAGPGLSLAGTEFSVAPAYRLPQQCASGQVAKWDGLGWICAVDANGGGTVTAVTASSPLQSSGGTTPNLTIPRAGATSDGYLSAGDWSNFNGKQARVTGTCAAGSALNAVNGDGTVGCTPVGAQRFFQGPGGVSGFDPPGDASWVDVPGTAITRIWEPGQYRALFVGQLWLTGANGTLYMRIIARFPDGSQFDIANSITQRFQSVFPESSRDTQFFALQGNLFSLSSGEATIVAQVNNNHQGWSVSHMTMIVER